MFKKIFSRSLLNFWLFVFFSVGIAFGFYFPFFKIFVVFAFICTILIYLFYKKQSFFISDIFILLFFFSLGTLWIIPSNYHRIDTFVNKNNRCTLKVVSLPQTFGLKNTFLAEMHTVSGVPLYIRVKVNDYTQKMEYLNTYEVIAKLGKRKYRNFDFYFIWVKANATVKRLVLSTSDRFTKATVTKLLNIFRNNLTEGAYRFIASVFLGRRELLREEAQIFTNAGIAHLLAISGSNIALIALVVFFMLKLFGITYRPRTLIALLVLFIYMLITGVNLPTLRAVIMYALVGSGFLLQRKVNMLSSLGLAGLVCLLMHPLSLFDVGFQLSFLSVFALLVGFAVVPLKSFKSRTINYLQYLFFASLFVTLFITPLVSYYFGRIYLLTIFYNVILIPFFSFILVVNSILILFSPFRPITQAIGDALSLLIFLFVTLSRFLGSIRFSFINCTFPLWAIILYYVLLLLLFIFLAQMNMDRNLC